MWRHWILSWPTGETDTIGLGGSNIARVIETGLSLFSEDASPERLMLLFSDGAEDHMELETILARAAHLNVRIVALGLGNTQPSRIPLYDAAERFTTYLEVDGQVVTTRLNEASLKGITAATQGRYFRVGPQGDWSDLLTQTSVAGDTPRRDERQVFQPFLLVGFLALCGHKLATRL